jgi:hypothetical protein
MDLVLGALTFCACLNPLMRIHFRSCAEFFRRAASRAVEGVECTL